MMTGDEYFIDELFAGHFRKIRDLSQYRRAVVSGSVLLKSSRYHDLQPQPRLLLISWTSVWPTLPAPMTKTLKLLYPWPTR